MARAEAGIPHEWLMPAARLVIRAGEQAENRATAAAVVAAVSEAETPAEQNVEGAAESRTLVWSDRPTGTSRTLLL